MNRFFSNIECFLEYSLDLRVVTDSLLGLEVDDLGFLALTLIEFQNGHGLLLVDLHAVTDHPLVVVLSNDQLHTWMIIALIHLLLGQERFHLVPIRGVDVGDVVVLAALRAHTTTH